MPDAIINDIVTRYSVASPLAMAMFTCITSCRPRSKFFT